MMEELNFVQKLIIWAPPVLLAITLHEVAHGWTALHFGDPTAQTLGRLSLNPLRHVDPLGTLLVPGILLFLGGFLFGWAKPVPVNPRRLRNPKRDMAWVALAGPGANLVMAVGWAMLMVLGRNLYEDWPQLGIPFYFMGHAGISINIVLAVLNLLPVPSLDGSRVLAGFLPDRFAIAMAQWEPYGLVIVVLLLMSGLLGVIMEPAIRLLLVIIFTLFGY